MKDLVSEFYQANKTKTTSPKVLQNIGKIPFNLETMYDNYKVSL